MKRLPFVLLLTAVLSSCAQDHTIVTFKTPFGNMVALLYDDTPKHKANFIKLAKQGYFDSTLFHRIIPGFMIQGGDPDSKSALPGQLLGNGGPGYTVPAEIMPNHYNMRGALAAAREGDDVNPTKASSGSQFYIVDGQVVTDGTLTQLESRMQFYKKEAALNEALRLDKNHDILMEARQRSSVADTAWLDSFFSHADTIIVKEFPDYKPFVFSKEQRTAYETVGGAPHLDGEYTVFGEVISGLDVISKIASQPRDTTTNRPTKDIRMSVTVRDVSDAELEKIKAGNK